MELRSYQQRALDNIRNEFTKVDSTLLVHPTGAGKTIIFSHLAKEYMEKGRIMVLAHMEELVGQAWRKLDKVTGESPDTEMGEWSSNEWGAYKSNIVVGTIQTQISKRGDDRRMHKFDPDEFSLLIIDEAHHAAAQSYRRVIDYYRQNKNIKILGATATPDRADEKALGEIFESVADEYEIVDAIDDGWLVPIYARPVEVEGLDYSQVRTTAGDLNGADLSKVLEYEEILHKFAWPIIDFSGDKKTLVFTASVAQAERLCEILNRHKPNSAQWVHGGTPKEQRRELWPAYAKGEFQYLVNCGITIEGWDEPGVQIVAIARPTKSRSRYAQMVGRGTRPLDRLVDNCVGPEARKLAIASSIKPHVDILDFVGNSGRHRLMTPADILGGMYEDIEVDGRLISVTERAQQNAIQKAAETGESVNIEDELDTAQKQLLREAKDAAEKKRREHIKLRAKYSTGIINPFAVFDIQPWREREWNKGRQPTDKQIAFLKQSGVDPAGLSFTHASQIIDRIIKNRTNKMATFKQLKVLQKFKYETDNVTFKEASQIIDELARNNWKRIG